MTRAGGSPPDLEDIARLPKAELHVHLEGTAGPELLAGILGADTAGIPPFRRGDFGAFLEHYRGLLDLLTRVEHYGALTRHYLGSAASHGLRHLELTLSLGSALRRGHEPRALLESIGAAAAPYVGTTVVTIVVDTVRQFGPEEAERVLDAVLPNLDLGIVSGFGMGGDEGSVPAAGFRRVFERARDHGLGLTVHSGESGDARAVAEVLECLRPDRIAHGIAAARDPRLLDRLARSAVTLDICPGSNVALGIVGHPSDHPLATILAAGVGVTLGTDDPGIFGTDLTREYRLAAEIAGLDLGDLERIGRHSLDVAFAPVRV